MKEIFNFEYKRIVSKSWFLVSCFLLPIATLVVIIIPQLVGNTKPEATILVGGSSPLTVATIGELKLQPQVSGWDIKHTSDSEGAKKLVEQKKAKIYIEIKENEAVLYSENQADPFNQIIVDTFKNAYVNVKLFERGIDPAEIKKMKNEAKIKLQFVGQANRGKEMNFIIYILTSLLYLSLIIFGDLLAHKVIEDKESNFIEVLLLYKKPLDVFLGKYFAVFTSYLTLLSTAFGITYLILISIKGNFLYILIKNTLSSDFIGELTLIFFVAYLMYSALFVLSGALSNTEDDLKKFNFIIYIILAVSSVTEFTLRQLPPTSFGNILAYFPFSAPFFYLTKSIQGNINLFQLSIAIAVMCVTSFLIIQFAASRFKIKLLSKKKLDRKPLT